METLYESHTHNWKHDFRIEDMICDIEMNDFLERPNKFDNIL